MDKTIPPCPACGSVRVTKAEMVLVVSLSQFPLPAYGCEACGARILAKDWRKLAAMREELDAYKRKDRIIQKMIRASQSDDKEAWLEGLKEMGELTEESKEEKKVGGKEDAG